MGTRSNACSELTRFWLQARHRCVVDESVPVKVPFGNSDIDLVAVRANLQPFQLPDGTSVGPRLIVETKDEHDFDTSGSTFGGYLRKDIGLMDAQPYIPEGAGAAKFSMLREQHYRTAAALFGTTDFDRLFVVHALNPKVRGEVAAQLASQRIHWLTIRELVADLLPWYRAHETKAVLRNSLIGDLLHLLVGYCGLDVTDTIVK